MAKKIKSDYLKMIDLGEWLRDFLNEPISGWHIRELTDRAITHYDIEYKIIDDPETDMRNSYLFELINQRLNENPDTEKKVHEDLRNKKWEEKDRIEWPISKIEQRDLIDIYGDLNKKKQIENDPLFKLYALDPDKAKNLDPDTQKLRSVWLKLLEKMFAAIFQTKFDIFKIIRAISDSPTPWHITLNLHSEDLAQIKNKTNYTENEKKILRDLDQKEKIFQAADRLKRSYPKLGEHINFTKTGVEKPKKFNDGYVRGIIPWDVIASRTLFDFLISGGHEYIGFCNRCDKLYIAQRKGRKKFCSDVCRTLNQKQ